MSLIKQGILALQAQSKGAVYEIHSKNKFSDLENLSAAALIENTQALVRKERDVMLEVLDHLAEIERRGLHLARGYGSLHEFAVEALKYSSAAAQRRIQSMRAMRDVPTIRPQIQSGELNLSQVALIQTVARSEKISVDAKRGLFEQAVQKTTRETEILLHEHFPENRKLTDRRVVVSAERTELRITLSNESLTRLQNLKHRLAHQIRAQTDSEAIEVILKIAEQALQKKDGVIFAGDGTSGAGKTGTPTRTESAQTPSHSPTPHRREDSRPGHNPRIIPRPHIPVATVRALKKRAQGQCEYVDPITQKKCTSRFALQVDHQTPVSKGGSARFENLIILCAKHNQWKGTGTTG